MKILDFLNSQKFIKHLKNKGAEIYLVGGIVRDHFLNKASKDIDLLVLNMSLEKIQKELKNFGIVDILGESFAVIKFKPTGYKGEPIDIAIPRIDVKKEKGHKGFDVITEGVSLKDDLYRRDFTINSMAMELNGVLIDPFKRSL